MWQVVLYQQRFTRIHLHPQDHVLNVDVLLRNSFSCNNSFRGHQPCRGKVFFYVFIFTCKKNQSLCAICVFLACLNFVYTDFPFNFISLETFIMLRMGWKCWTLKKLEINIFYALQWDSWAYNKLLIIYNK